MIKIVNVDSFIREKKLLGPITSPQIFLGKSYSFHPQGILSEDFFGIEGSSDRRSSLSWINLNCSVLHPSLYDMISKGTQKSLKQLLAGEKTFRLGEDGTLIEDDNGDLNGYGSFIKIIDKFRFTNEGEDDTQRNKVINMMYDSIKNGTFLMNKLLVIAPDFRQVLIPSDPNERPEIGDMNELYNRVIILSNQLKSVSGSLFDILCFKMQQLLAELHAYTRSKISKKSGMIRNLMLGRRLDFSARSVIVPNPTLKLGEVGVPLRTCCSIFEPILIYGLVNSPESKFIPEEFHKEVKAFLGKELDPDLLGG